MDKKTKSQRLFELAELQAGLFTSRQAVKIGYTKNNHPYHVSSGHWIKEYRGIYRLAQFPRSQDEQYMLWYLWSRGKDDIPQGIYSHQTALSFYDLSDLMPAKLHMTVPKRFSRKKEVIPKILRLHKANLSEEDIELARGFKITKPLRAIQDLFEDQTVEVAFLKQAVREGLEQGLISKKELKNPKLPKDFRLAILEWVFDKAV